MKKIFILLILGAFLQEAIGQENTNSTGSFSNINSIQAELFGHGLFYSLNYERILLNGQKFKTTGQAGIAYYPPQTGILDVWIPVLINELYSFNKHHIEFGLGYVFIYEALRNIDHKAISWGLSGVFTGRIGYRYQKSDSRFIFRIGFTPFYEYMYDFHPSGGLSIGYSF